MTCIYVSNKIELRLLVRKYKALHFEEVSELDLFDEFSTSGNYSDVVLTKLANGQFYASFDPSEIQASQIRTIIL